MAIIVDKNHKCEMMEQFRTITPDFEILTLRYRKYVFSVVYRPPQTDISRLLEIFERLFTSVNDQKCTLVVGGDFNIDILESSRSQREFTNTLRLYDMYNVIVAPARVTSTTSTILDLFITNSSHESVACCGVISATISDHMPIFVLKISARNKYRSGNHKQSCDKSKPRNIQGAYSQSRLGTNIKY